MISLSLTLGGELMILMVTRSASFGGRSRRGRLRVNRVDFGMSTLGLLSLDSGHPGSAASCQCTKSLRDSPLRGGVTGSTVIVDRTSSLLRQKLEPLFYRSRGGA